jgi:hypothetical protein
LKTLVVLENLLDGSGHVVVLLANLHDVIEQKLTRHALSQTYDTRVKHAGLGIQRIHSRIDTQLSDTT